MAAGIPTSLVLDAGTVSTGTTGAKEITISQAITAGAYALVAVFDAAPTMNALGRGTDAASGHPSLWGSAGVFGGAEYPYNQYKAFAYAALENPFTGTPTYNTTGLSGNLADTPYIWLRP